MKKVPLQTIGMIGAGILLISSIIFGFAISFQLQQVSYIEKDFFQGSIPDMSSALNRVIFAAAEFTAYYIYKHDEPDWLEASYHTQLRTNLEWTQEVVEQILIWQAIAVFASLVVMIISYRSQTRHVKVLKGLIPICSKCKKVRDDKGYWSQVETYIRDRSEADFSHGICPECVKELYPYFAHKMKSQTDDK